MVANRDPRRTSPVLKGEAPRSVINTQSADGQVRIQSLQLPKVRGELSDNVLARVDKARFVRENRDLLSVFEGNPDLAARLQDRTVKERADLETVLREAATDKLGAANPITDGFLRDRPELAMVLALNAGGITDKLATNTDAAKAVVDGSIPFDADLKKRLAAEAIKLFPNRDTMKMRESFLEEQPVAAVYFLLHPDRAADLYDDISQTKLGLTGPNDQDWINRFTANKPVYENEILSFGYDLINELEPSVEFKLGLPASGLALLPGAQGAPFFNTGWAIRPDIASPAVKEFITLTVGQFVIETNPEMTRGDVDAADKPSQKRYETLASTDRFAVARSFQMLADSSKVMGEAFFQRNTGLANAALRFPEIATALQAGAATVDKALDTAQSPSPLEAARNLRAVAPRFLSQFERGGKLVTDFRTTRFDIKA